MCLKAGNAAILRGGSESHHSSVAIHACLVEGLRAAELPEAAIQLVADDRPRRRRRTCSHGLDGAIDVIVPRGGKSLVERVQKEARVPVFAHLEGICHTYVDRGADMDIAMPIVLNAKMRRTGVCGATECLLVDKNADDDNLTPLVKALLDAGCEVRGDAATVRMSIRASSLHSRTTTARNSSTPSSPSKPSTASTRPSPTSRATARNTPTPSSPNAMATAERFLQRVDSAIVLVNASTQFADGGEFGFGGEIGIATGKMHARGPVGVEQLTSFKYVVRGTGQTRPG